MAHIAADGSKWSNASQARKIPVPGRAQGDGKQPVKSFSKPEPARAATSSSSGSDSPTSPSPEHPGSEESPTVEVTQDGNSFVVTAKYASADEAHAAAQALQQPSDDSSAMPRDMNPAQAMM